MTTDQKTIILYLTRELIIRLMDEFHLDLMDSMKAVYNSATFARLSNVSTGEYEYGSVGVYNDLRTEYLFGKPLKEY